MPTHHDIHRISAVTANAQPLSAGSVCLNIGLLTNGTYPEHEVSIFGLPPALAERLAAAINAAAEPRVHVHETEAA